MKTKEELQKIFNKQKAAAIKVLFASAAAIVSANKDMEMAVRTDDFYELELEHYPDLDKKIDIDSMFSKETLDRYTRAGERLEKYQKDKKLKKADMVDVLSDIFSDPVLTESFLMLLPPGDGGEGIRDAYAGLGLQEEFEEVSSGEAFRLRREYFSKIYTYAEAAVNLYGSLSVLDFVDIVRHYNRRFLHLADYQKPGENYPFTVIYSPEYFDDDAAQEMTDGNFFGIHATMDGLMINSAFTDEYNEEMSGFIEYMKKNKDKGMTEDDLLDGYFVGRETAYRRLFFETRSKDRYLPSESTFMAYADPLADEWDSGYEDELETFILGHYDEKDNKDATIRDPEDVADVIIYSLRDIMADHCSEPFDVDPQGDVQEALDLMGNFGVHPDNDDEINDLLQIFMGIANNSRLWFNNGHTPNELSGAMTSMPTIVPESSRAAEMLSQAAPMLNRSGMNVDLTPASVTRTGKKIYPNDPCPCGSGKKYKYCHGKRK